LADQPAKKKPAATPAFLFGKRVSASCIVVAANAGTTKRQ
jgi:hypothetical protein